MSNLTPEQRLRLEVAKEFSYMVGEWGVEKTVHFFDCVASWVITGQMVAPNHVPENIMQWAKEEAEKIPAEHFRPQPPVSSFASPWQEALGWVRNTGKVPNWYNGQPIELIFCDGMRGYSANLSGGGFAQADLDWFRLAPPEIPDGWKLYNFSGESPADFGGEVMFWDGGRMTGNMWHWHERDVADSTLQEGSNGCVIFAYRPKAVQEPVQGETKTECGDDSPETQDATQAETSGEIGLTKPTWEWDPENPTMPPWSRVWTGGKQPVADDVRVVALMRDGEIFYDHDADTWLVSWENSITEWATLDPEQMPEEREV